MASLALGVVGGVVGFIASGFNPMGASLGFALGPLAGDLVHSPVVPTEEPQDEETQE